MSKDDVPEWAIDRVGEICGYDPRHHAAMSWWWTWPSSIAFARYIAAHEQPPVDWLQEIVKQAANEALKLGLPQLDVRLTAALRARIPNIDQHAPAAGEGEK